MFYPDAELIGDIGASVAALGDRLDGVLHAEPGMLALRAEILGRINERSDAAAFR